jgi:hypothetical protein
MPVDTRAAAKVAPSQKLVSTEPTAEDFALLWAEASIDTRIEIAAMLYAANGTRRLPPSLRDRLRTLALRLRASRLKEDRAAAQLIRNVWG